MEKPEKRIGSAKKKATKGKIPSLEANKAQEEKKISQNDEESDLVGRELIIHANSRAGGKKGKKTSKKAKKKS